MWLNHRCWAFNSPRDWNWRIAWHVCDCHSNMLAGRNMVQHVETRVDNVFGASPHNQEVRVSQPAAVSSLLKEWHSLESDASNYTPTPLCYMTGVSFFILAEWWNVLFSVDEQKWDSSSGNHKYAYQHFSQSIQQLWRLLLLEQSGGMTGEVLTGLLLFVTERLHTPISLPC